MSALTPHAATKLAAAISALADLGLTPDDVTAMVAAARLVAAAAEYGSDDDITPADIAEAIVFDGARSYVSDQMEAALSHVQA